MNKKIVSPYLDLKRLKKPKDDFKNCLNILKKKIKLDKKKIIDIGCANGEFLNFMISKYPNNYYCGVDINKSFLKNNLNIVDLIIFSKLESSKSEIRRLIKGNAIKINNNIFKIARKYGLHAELYNLLTSILYRLSYNFEVINLSISNNFLPYLRDFTSLSGLFVTDIGIAKLLQLSGVQSVIMSSKNPK